VTEQRLDYPDVDAAFEQVGGEFAKGMYLPATTPTKAAPTCQI
jgi:hypothetical protein